MLLQKISFKFWRSDVIVIAMIKGEIIAVENRSHGQARSQDFAKGGGFFERWKQQETNLTQIFIMLESDWGGFSVKIRWPPKKGLHQNSVTYPDQVWVRSTTFLVQITASPSQLLLPNPVGGLFSFLDQKSASKALKTCYFAYFSGQWGEGL